jgi:hypothetical protein
MTHDYFYVCVILHDCDMTVLIADSNEIINFCRSHHMSVLRKNIVEDSECFRARYKIAKCYRNGVVVRFHDYTYYVENNQLVLRKLNTMNRSPMTMFMDWGIPVTNFTENIFFFFNCKNPFKKDTYNIEWNVPLLIQFNKTEMALKVKRNSITV